MQKTTVIRYAGIIICCVVLDVFLHVLTSAYSTIPESPNFTLFANFFGTEITAILWALLAFSGVAYVFHRCQKTIHGVGITKGLRYGFAIAILWLFAMLEGVSLFGNSIIKEFVVGLSDAIPVLVMGTLLGVFTTKKDVTTQSVQFTLAHKLLSICIFTSVFILGRYVVYFTGIVRSGYQSNPIYTFLWTFLMGACIGIVYILLGQAAQALTVVRSAVKFGFFIFGVNWFVFLVFMPILFTGFFTDFLFRVSIDVLLVTLSYYLSTHILIRPAKAT
jgi:hypothetical protein